MIYLNNHFSYKKRAAGSHPHYGQSPFAFIKAVQNFQYWNVRDRFI